MTITPSELEKIYYNRMRTIDVVLKSRLLYRQVSEDSPKRAPIIPEDGDVPMYDKTKPGAILHNTSLSLIVDRYMVSTEGRLLSEEENKPAIEVHGKISSALKVVLSTYIYHQILETLKSLSDMEKGPTKHASHTDSSILSRQGSRWVSEYFVSLSFSGNASILKPHCILDH